MLMPKTVLDIHESVDIIVFLKVSIPLTLAMYITVLRISQGLSFL